MVAGPNGGGKTTLVRTLLGMIPPLSGSVTRPRGLGRAGVGFVPQPSEVHSRLPMLVEEFVSLGLVGLPCRRRERRERLERALEVVDIGSLTGQDCRTLSGGQRQRTRIARALIREPTVLIADEPTAGLDLHASDEVLHAFRDLHERHGLTVMLVSHDLSRVAPLATHAAICSSRRVEAGPIRDILTPERLGTAYGVPFEVEDGTTGWSIRPRVGVRAHDIPEGASRP